MSDLDDIESVAIAVLDQELCANASSIFPTSYDWDDVDSYFESLTDLASALDDLTVQPYWVFVDMDTYSDFCERADLEFDDVHSRAMYAQFMLAERGGIPYNPTQALWPLGVFSIISRSQDDFAREVKEGQLYSGDLVRQYSEYIAQVPGQYRLVISASRYADPDIDGLWQHFSDAIRQCDRLFFDESYLSVDYSIQHKDHEIECVDWGDVDPIYIVSALGEITHGLIGIEHRYEHRSTIRAFEISSAGISPVPVATLSKAIKIDGYRQFCSGWDSH